MVFRILSVKHFQKDMYTVQNKFTRHLSAIQIATDSFKIRSGHVVLFENISTRRENRLSVKTVGPNLRGSVERRATTRYRRECLSLNDSIQDRPNKTKNRNRIYTQNTRVRG